MIVCPNCGANLKFNPKSGSMQCDFCGSTFDPKEFDVSNDAEEQTIEEQSDPYDNKEEDTYDVTIYTCPQCGGELLSVDENTAAAFCSFCGASTILTARIAKDKRPEYIIPFSVTKEDCKKAYLNMVRKALFLPKEYKSPEYIDGFRGIYMPYWSYDVVQKGPVKLKGERSHRSGDYIITEHYNLTGNIDATYEGISYDAASTFSDSISEALSPFDVTKRVPFEPSYMSGFYADIADVDRGLYAKEASDFAYDRSLERIKSETSEFHRFSISDPKLKEGTDKDKVTDTSRTSFSSRTVAAHSSMYPVWFLSYRNHDRVTYATVNGQTGKAVADLPIDIRKYLIGTAVLAALIFAFLNMFLILRPSTLLIIAIILTVAVFIINASQRSSIQEVVEGTRDKGLTHTRNKIRLSRQKKLQMSGENTEGTEDNNKKKGNDLPEKIKVEEAEMAGFEKISLAVGIIMVIIELLTVFAITPVSDLPYYVMVMIDALIFIFSFKYTLINYNLMATRRLPQFDRKGGDDRA